MVKKGKEFQSDLFKASKNNPQSPIMSGPQFGSKDIFNKKNKIREWINEYSSSVILPIIALAILAGGIYLYASQNNEQSNLFPEDNLANIGGQLSSDPEEGLITSSNEEDTKKTIENIIPQGRKEGSSIVEKATKGDGVTNLARRALKDYTKENPQEMTNEHKIFIEDYIKDKTGSKPLEVGEEITFSEDLIKEAINASLELTPGQLSNLEQYSALVAW